MWRFLQLCFFFYVSSYYLKSTLPLMRRHVILEYFWFWRWQTATMMVFFLIRPSFRMMRVVFNFEIFWLEINFCFIYLYMVLTKKRFSEKMLNMSIYIKKSQNILKSYYFFPHCYAQLFRVRGWVLINKTKKSQICF